MENLLDRSVVGLFVKEPRPNHVMTRLGEDVGMRNAAIFYGECIALLYERLIENDIHTVVFPARTESIKFFKQALEIERDEYIQAQSGDHLGERMFNGLLYLKSNYEKLPIILGSDAPLLPIDRIEETITGGKSNDVVLGPAEDGGYYLIATKKPKIGMFERIEWSQPQVLNKTIDRLDELGMSYELLSEWNDIDSLDDLVGKRIRLTN